MGAGPGGIELITRKGYQLIRQADAVLSLLNTGKKTLTKQLPLFANSRFDTFDSVRYDYEIFAFNLVTFLFGFLFAALSDSGRL